VCFYDILLVLGGYVGRILAHEQEFSSIRILRYFRLFAHAGDTKRFLDENKVCRGCLPITAKRDSQGFIIELT
jgi:hypothetical protein